MARRLALTEAQRDQLEKDRVEYSVRVRKANEQVKPHPRKRDREGEL